MPLVPFDVVEGRSDNEIKNSLDAAHRAVLSAFQVPERNYQIYHEHPPSRLVAEEPPDPESDAEGIWWW
jgi:hypothetical protein